MPGNIRLTVDVYFWRKQATDGQSRCGLHGVLTHGGMVEWECKHHHDSIRAALTCAQNELDSRTGNRALDVSRAAPVPPRHCVSTVHCAPNSQNCVIRQECY